MLDYSWPGNIRQLESVIERAYIMCDEEMIGVEHVPGGDKTGRKPELVGKIAGDRGPSDRREAHRGRIPPLPLPTKLDFQRR